jgi:putative PIN family toxin of toxin-antitoxin system
MPQAPRAEGRWGSDPVSRSTKSTAESAEKPAIIFVHHCNRKLSTGMSLGHPTLATTPRRKALVLDTNVTLDWLVFKNPASLAVGDAIRSHRVAWWSTDSLRDEFEHVMQRGLDPRWTVDADLLAETWTRWVAAPPVHQRIETRPPRCRDPDDQKFLDFAVQSGADWLLTRDRDLLVLRRRVATEHAVKIITPEAWILQHIVDTNTDAIDVCTHSYPQAGASI